MELSQQGQKAVVGIARLFEQQDDDTGISAGCPLDGGQMAFQIRSGTEGDLSFQAEQAHGAASRFVSEVLVNIPLLMLKLDQLNLGRTRNIEHERQEHP